MAVYKIFPSADATVYSSYPAKNTGRDEMLEVSVKNSNDALRFTSRALLEQSPYYNYDLAVDDNFTIPLNIPSTPDIRRTLLQFSNADINALKTFASQSVSSSWEAALRLNLAFAQNLNTTYSLEAYPLTQAWSMGTGKYANLPEGRNGVSWAYTGPYQASSQWQQNPLYWNNLSLGTWNNLTWLTWDSSFPNIGPTWTQITTNWNQTSLVYSTPPTFITGGGSWNPIFAASQSFDYMSSKDINMNITDILGGWFSGSVQNYGLVLKHPDYIETSSGSFVDLKFFSVDTHTIYPPCIELRWNDSHYFPVGSNYVLNDQFTVTIANNPGTFKQGSIYKFRTSARDTYPARQFTTASVYTQAKYLSEQSYWAIQDLKTNEMIVDFHEVYTKMSADNTSNYFYVYMSGLEPERFYKLLIKTKVYTTTYGPLSVYDNEQSIYDALSIYGPNDLALLPAEEILIDNNFIFKVIR